MLPCSLPERARGDHLSLGLDSALAEDRHHEGRVHRQASGEVYLAPVAILHLQAGPALNSPVQGGN